MMEDVKSQVETLLAEIQGYQAGDSAALEAFRLRFLGSKNILKPLFGYMSKVDGDDRRTLGQLLNTVKTAAEARFEELKGQVAESADTGSEPAMDLSLPPDPYLIGSRHPVSIITREITSIFSRIGFVVAEEREIEDDWHNFSSMNTPEDHPARDMQDTFYLKGIKDLLLRTHTSSVQARVMTTQKPPIRIIAPGRVYRNETISARSHCQFHQVEGLYVDEGVSFADMKQTLYYYARAIYGDDVRIRLRPSYFPFTEPSAEMDVYWGLKSEMDYRITKGTGWLEIMGCGMVDPAVLTNCGIDPDKYSGFAFGMGIERQAMLKYRIGDIRLFFENDVRFLRQFTSVHVPS
jgi:phenylalanyl-tRNA synthetase alpha chain